MNKTKFLKRCDRVLGVLLSPFFSAPERQKADQLPHKILIIRPGGIGDAVLLIPTVQSLKQQFPHIRITVLAEKRNASAFILCPDIQEILRYDKPTELLRALRGSFDVVLDTEQWHRLPAIVARFTGAPMSIGFATNERSRLFTHNIPYSHDEYEVLSFLNLLTPLGIVRRSEYSTPFLTVPENEMQRAEELLGDLSEKSFIAIFPGGSIRERRWGAEKFKLLAGELNAEGFPVAVVGGKEDTDAGEIIVAENHGINVAGKMSLVETAAVIKKSAVLVSGDSGALHVGVGLNRPTVSLFGPGIAKKWAPQGDRHIVINKSLPCSPCTMFGYTRKCPVNSRCMEEITVGEVFAAVKELIRSGKTF
jgi:heptosyltransferase II